MTAVEARYGEGRLHQFYDQTQHAFEQACRARGTLVHSFEIAGRRIRISFAGSAMVPHVLPALQHLEVGSDGDCELRIAVWDSASTGVELPEPPWDAGALASRCEIVGLESSAELEIAYQPGSGVLTMLDGEGATAMIWIDDSGSCPYWEAAAPLRSLLHWWCAKHDQQLVHGAAVGLDEGAILLTGKGGSGKSTTALQALTEGMQYLGDDYVVCELLEGRAKVHSLYNTAKVDRAALRRLPQLAAKISDPPAEQEQAVLFANHSYAGQLTRSADLKVILVPKVTGELDSRLYPLKPSQAFLALAPTTVFQLPGAGQDTTAFLRRLVSTLPSFMLELGQRPEGVIPILRSAILNNA
jgi:hypothetical protein